MKLAIVGRGRATEALVPRWLAAGHELVGQRSRRDGSGTIEVLAAADVVVLAVSDGAIAEVARALAMRPSAGEEIWVHLSGSQAAAVMRVGPGVPAAVVGMHPLVALTEGATLDGAVAGIEGEAPALAIGERLARDAGLVPVRVEAGRKMAYHAAAVTVAGHATALFAQAMDLMAAAGLGTEDARRALQPLFVSAANNLARGGPAAVSTGPVVRGDVGTIAGHLAAIVDPAIDPGIGATYRLLARRQLALVADRLAPEVAAEIVRLLDG